MATSFSFAHDEASRGDMVALVDSRPFTATKHGPSRTLSRYVVGAIGGKARIKLVILSASFPGVPLNSDKGIRGQ